MGILFGVFAAVTFSVGLGYWQEIDQGMTRYLQWGATQERDCQAVFFNWVGSPEATGLAALALAGYFWVKRSLRESLIFAGAMGLGTILEVLIKFSVPQMPIPESVQRECRAFPAHGIFWLSTPGSFPSGHMFRTAFLLFALDRVNVWRMPVWALRMARPGIAAVLILMFLTRIYLGDHWTSDVVGGLILAWACAGLLPRHV